MYGKLVSNLYKYDKNMINIFRCKVLHTWLKILN